MAILMTTVKTVFLFIYNMLKGHSGESLDDFGHSCKFLDKMPKEQSLNDKQDFNKM